MEGEGKKKKEEEEEEEGEGEEEEEERKEEEGKRKEEGGRRKKKEEAAIYTSRPAQAGSLRIHKTPISTNNCVVHACHLKLCVSLRLMVTVSDQPRQKSLQDPISMDESWTW
jgi:hypothetical protein